MKITALETIRIAKFPNLIWLKMHTSEGIVGLGETFFFPATVEAYVHEAIAPKLIGRDPFQIERISKDLVGYLGCRSTGAEMRAASALDIALWDIVGKATGQPIAQLLGGFSRDKIRTYNTCAGTAYMRENLGQSTANWGLARNQRRYDDLNGFPGRADELAQELLSEGITAMKIWPFDMTAEANDGVNISNSELKRALEPFEKIRPRGRRKNRGNRRIPFHFGNCCRRFELRALSRPTTRSGTRTRSKWTVSRALSRYAEASVAPICASETLASRWAFRDLFETGAAGVIMLDLSWCGGLSEAKKIASMAEGWRLPVAPHDCTGPVVLCASTHLSLNAPNAIIQESVRAYYRIWYQDLATALPKVENGTITIPPGPGLGMELGPDLSQRFTASVSKSP